MLINTFFKFATEHILQNTLFLNLHKLLSMINLSPLNNEYWCSGCSNNIKQKILIYMIRYNIYIYYNNMCVL